MYADKFAQLYKQTSLSSIIKFLLHPVHQLLKLNSSLKQSRFSNLLHNTSEILRYLGSRDFILIYWFSF